MRAVSASAPGKIVLCGEYAVLFGAPAVVTAVDCRARVEVRIIAGNESRLSVPGMHAATARFRREGPGEFHWSAARYRLVEEVIDALDQSKLPAIAYTLDTQAFRDESSGKKIGFGSSAAVATALAAALLTLLDLHSDVHAVAASAHWAYQSGTGSGVDIAASVTGGTLRFEKSDVPDIRTLNWPDGLEYSILWSGHPSSTTRILRRLDTRSAAVRPSGVALSFAAHEVANLWETGSTSKLLGGLRDYVSKLQQFSEDHAIGIFDAGHQQLLEPAEALGLVYKPCGAGGGDIGVVFGTDSSAISEFCKHAESNGFARLDLAVSSPGVSSNWHKEA